MHPEQGPIWKWYFDNAEEVADRLGANFNKYGPGALRKIPEENLEEVRKIFEVTGGNSLHEKIEQYSKEKAKEMQMPIDTEGIDNKYFEHIYTENSDNHQK